MGVDSGMIKRDWNQLSLKPKPTIERFGKTHPWAEDGIYDHQKFLTRYWVKEGRAVEVASLLWIQSDKANELSPAMQAPWGTYPDMPPRPKTS